MVVNKLKSLAVSGGIAGFTHILAYLGKGHTDPFIGKSTILQTTAGLAVGIQLAAFLPSYLFQTERFFDVTGSLTYCICTGYSLYAGKVANGGVLTFQARLASILVLAWAVRLGSFLFFRIMKDGKDSRFDKIKPDFGRFMNVWVLQGLWVFLTALPVFITNASQGLITAPLSPIAYAGVALWLAGFGIETAADYQKRVWRALKNKKNEFIDVGLWNYSRHPNYFGEITLWIGVYLLCVSSFKGTQHIAILSPFFVYSLLNYVSGVPLLEASSDKKFGHLKAYQIYKQTTSCLVPLPKGWAGDKVNKK